MDDLDAGRVDAALARLKQLSAINDRWYDIHLLMGDAYLAKQDVDHALVEYAAAAVLNSTSAAPALSMARALIVQGSFDRALQKIDEAARLEPDLLRSRWSAGAHTNGSSIMTRRSPNTRPPCG